MLELPAQNQDDMNSDYGDNPLHMALAKAQSQLTPAIKDSTNPHFKTRYADLANVWDACRKPLTDNGLSVTQTFVTKDTTVLLVTTLRHIKGGTVVSELPVISKDPSNPQALGSAITYMRRYALAAMIGVVADDDDGQAASKPALATKPVPLDPVAQNKEPAPGDRPYTGSDISSLRVILQSLDYLKNLDTLAKSVLIVTIENDLIVSQTPLNRIADVVRKHTAKYLKEA